jgi:hypothetical protein
MKDLSKAEPVAVCPVCGGKILDAGEQYLCEKSQADATPCRFKLNKAILQQAIRREQLTKLAFDGRTDLLTQFISKSGRPFAAFLVLDENRKISFEFPPNGNPKIPARLATLPQPPLKPAPRTEASPPPAPPGFEKAHQEWLRIGGHHLPGPNAAFYESQYWNLVRETVLTTRGFKCCRCGSQATQVHHLNYDFVGEDHFHPETLVAICRPCHGLVEYARRAESLVSRISRRISLCKGFVKDQASYKDQNPVHIYARLLEYQDELEEMRRLFRVNIHYINPRLKTKAECEAVSVRFKLRNQAYHEKAGAIVSHWEGTEIEKSTRLLPMLALEIENCRKFVPEVFAPVSPHPAPPLPPTSPSALPRGESLVVGIKFHRGHVDGIRPGDAVQLVREPNNTYDRNAVRVNLDSGETLGYLTREFAAKVARQLYAGASLQAQVSSIIADKCQIGLLVRKV